MTVATAVLVALAPPGCGGGDTTDRTGAAPRRAAADGAATLPPDAAAMVGDRAIRRDDVARRLGAATARRQGAGLPVDPRATRRAIVAALIGRAVLAQELLRRGFGAPTAQQVSRRWRARRRALERRGELARFMRGRALSAVLLDIRIELLRETIHELEANRDPLRPARAIARFEHDVPLRWRKATVCRTGYEVPQCGE